MKWSIENCSRKANKVVQLVKHLKDCRKKAQAATSSDEYTVEIKEDGIYSFWVLNEDGTCQGGWSRTGNELVHVDRIVQGLEEGFSLKGAQVVMGELVNDTVSLEELGAMYKSSRKKPLSDGIATKAKKATAKNPGHDVGDRIHFDEIEANEHTYLRLFDVVTLDQFNEGISLTPFWKRRENVVQGLTSEGWGNQVIFLSRVLGQYHVDLDHIIEMSEKVIAKGEEGIVAKLEEAGWVAGRKDHTSFKIVSNYDIDLECVGYEAGDVGTKREGMVNKLIFRWKAFEDKSQPDSFLTIDGCATDSMRREWLEDPAQVLGTVFKIKGLCIGSQGSIRLAKFHEQRLDKSIPDL